MKLRRPFHHHTPIEPPDLLFRDSELHALRAAVSEQCGNFLIRDTRGVGKSSVARTLVKQIDKHERTVFVHSQSVMHFCRPVDDPGAMDRFLSDTLQQLCLAIWTRLLKKSSLDLLESTLAPKSARLGKAADRELKRIYALLCNEELGSNDSLGREVGISAIGAAKLQESSSWRSTRKALRPFEFSHLFREVANILAERNYERVLLIIDEFNYASNISTSLFFARFFELFQEQSLIFGIVGADFEEMRAPGVVESFGVDLELQAFKPQQVRSLIDYCMKAYGLTNSKPTAVFEVGTEEVIALITRGVPAYVQLLCDHVFRRITDIGDELVTRDFVIATARSMPVAWEGWLADLRDEA